uniref:Uncharacterized protein n=1 Tax=Arundo donax TaxID=35708 RepID=A0A0A9A996_ARUDO
MRGRSMELAKERRKAGRSMKISTTMGRYNRALRLRHRPRLAGKSMSPAADRKGSHALPREVERRGWRASRGTNL